MKNRKSEPFKKLRKIGALFGMGCLAFAMNQFALAEEASAFAPQVSWQTVLWQHLPLTVVLPVGKTLIIHVPHRASLGLPVSIANEVFSQRFDGWLYLTAKQPFAPVSAEIQDEFTGQTILLNLSASDDASNDAIQVVYPTNLTQNDSSRQAGFSLPNQTPVALQGSLALKTLTQFAEQQLYAPKRLLSNPDHIELVKSYANAKGQVSANQWFNDLFIDHSVMAMPWASWTGGNYYVTAVIIKNLLPIRLNLTENLVNLCGRLSGVWTSVTFFPYQVGHAWQLAPSGEHFDTTVAFLTSRVPFSQAIKACRREADA